MEKEKEQQELHAKLKEGMKSEDIAHIYFNGFITNIGAGDITVLLWRNDEPIAVLNTSYTVAKTLAQKLGELIESLEKRSGNTIMTTDDVKQRLTENEASE